MDNNTLLDYESFLQDELPKRFENGLINVAENYVALCKKYVPVASGHLKKMIKYKLMTTKDGSYRIVMYTGVKYSGYVEFGTGVFSEAPGEHKTFWRYKDKQGQWHSTHGSKPQSYMRKALEECQDKMHDWFVEGFLKDIPGGINNE